MKPIQTFDTKTAANTERDRLRQRFPRMTIEAHEHPEQPGKYAVAFIVLGDGRRAWHRV